jgi:hypothetical protein
MGDGIGGTVLMGDSIDGGIVLMGDSIDGGRYWGDSIDGGHIDGG